MPRRRRPPGDIEDARFLIDVDNADAFHSIAAVDIIDLMDLLGAGRRP